SIGPVNALTDVGAYSTSASYYGTYDQSGLVYDWNEAVIGSHRGMRGGSWDGGASDLPSSFRNSTEPANHSNVVGFRLATSVVPEPGTALFGMACVGVAALRRRRRA